MRNKIADGYITERPSIELAARSIYDAYQTRRACEPVRKCLSPRDVASAYAVQELNTIRWLSEGRRLSGRKIGLTARSVQKAAGIDQPDYGMLFADMEIASGNSIPADALFLPKAEAEIAFVLERDLAGESPSMADVTRAVAYALPSLEIVDTLSLIHI